MQGSFQSDKELFVQGHLASIVESSDDAIMTITLDAVITSWNSAAERIFGYSAPEMIGQSMEILTPPDRTNEELDILIRIGREEKVDHFETVRVRKDGKCIFISVTISPLRNIAGKIIGASKIARDITDLRKIEANSRSAVYLAAIGKLALVSITDHRGNITMVNQKFCEISGYSEDELIGQNHRILNSGVHPKAFWVDMLAMVAKGNNWHQEVCNRKKNGELYWIDSTIVPLKNKLGKIDSYLSVRVDITQLKHQEMALIERLKESTCLYKIRSSLLPESTISRVCQKIIEELTIAFQFPEITVVKIEIDNEQFSSANYTDDLVNGLYSKIKVDGDSRGKLHVFYLEDKSFLLPWEQNLINTIAYDLGKWLERLKAEQRISHLATHDELTGLPNRNLLQDRVARALDKNNRNHEHAAVLFIDLDHFKVINDSLGHKIGDFILKMVSARLTSAVRSEDTVARLGGDEFIIVLQNIACAADAGTVAQKILNTLAQPLIVENKELRVGASIGIAVFPNDGNSVETLMIHGDLAMYHAKEAGRNNYQFFTSMMNQLVVERYALGNDLHYALERNELQLHFQPVVSMPEGKMKSMEVLLRWQHPELGFVMPTKFIKLAEDIGLIVPIGEWVLRTTCMQIRAWLEQGYEVPKMAVNLSACQFRHKSLVADIKRILDETSVAAHYLTLEITESMVVQNIDEATRILNQLNAIGLDISMDDFGTGYSNLGNLKRFPINTLKIDCSFVQDITTDQNDAAIVAAIIAMARGLNMGVIAEGVETEDQLAFLTEQGCNRYQGYYFSKPLPASEIINKLQHMV